jgi:hypothetical protein
MEPQFFPGSRRRVILEAVILKRNAQDEKRIQLKFAMPLTGESLVGMPTPVAAADKAVGTLENGITETVIATDFEGYTLEFFPTPEALGHIELSKKVRVPVLSACDLRKLSVSRPASTASKKQDEVTLYFETNIPDNAIIWEWARPYTGKVFWVSFTKTEPQLPAANADQLSLEAPTAEPEIQADPEIQTELEEQLP